MVGRKRVYAMPVSNSNRPFKKRKFNRRRKTRGGTGRSNNFTSQRGSGSGLGYRAKMLGRSRFRRMLWDSTLFKKHYRSLMATNSTITSPNDQTNATVEIVTALRYSTNNFWLTAGGAIDPDGGTIPTFAVNDDILLRGGKISIRFANKNDPEATEEALDLSVFLIKTGREYDHTAVPVTPKFNWDPTFTPDFQTNIGRIVFRKRFLLKDAEVGTCEYRLKIQKLDQSDFALNKNTYVWMLVLSNPDSVGTRAVNYTASYSLSFTADAI